MDYDGFDFSLVTACGGCCSCCEKQENGYCQGCIETDGCCDEWKKSGCCPVYACAKNHGVKFCGLCSEFPCEELPSLVHWNPEIIQHQMKLADIYKLYRRKDE